MSRESQEIKLFPSGKVGRCILTANQAGVSDRGLNLHDEKNKIKLCRLLL